MSLVALASLALGYVVTLGSLLALSATAERSGKVYPFRSEDWLRYLLPSLWPPDDRLLLVTGPSTARENVLVEPLEDAFPQYRVYQGALSLGTLADVMVSLEYLEKAYGAKALPRVIVMGVSPRFLGEIPDDRPLALGLERYSRSYRTTETPPRGFGLQDKGVLEGAADHLRFLTTKQKKRYLAAAAWWTATLLGAERSEAIKQSSVTGPMLEAVAAATRRPQVAALGIHAYALELASPHKYREIPPWPLADLTGFLDQPSSFWHQTQRWDPAAHTESVRRRVADLLAFIERHDIELYVVSLPERTLGLSRYMPGYVEAYDRLLEDVFEGAPLLDIRCLLPESEFFDTEHALVPGAERVTRHVVGFMRDTRESTGTQEQWHRGCSAGSWSGS